MDDTHFTTMDDLNQYETINISNDNNDNDIQNNIDIISESIHLFETKLGNDVITNIDEIINTDVNTDVNNDFNTDVITNVITNTDIITNIDDIINNNEIINNDVNTEKTIINNYQQFQNNINNITELHTQTQLQSEIQSQTQSYTLNTQQTNNEYSINKIEDVIPDFSIDKINNLNQITHKISNFNQDKNEIAPKVTFTNINLNEIKEINTFNNSLNLSSNYSDSEISYTKKVKKHTTMLLNNTTNNSINNTKHNKHNKHNKNDKNNDIDDIDFLYNKLQDYCRYVTINRHNYIIIICKAIEIIENYKEMKHDNKKKDIVVKALNRLIVIDLDLCLFDKKLFINTLNNLIDLIINCTKINVIKNDKNQNDDIDDIILAKPGQIIHSLIDKLTTIIVKKHYCLDKIFSNMGTLTNILMILVDKYNYLSGIEKKIIVLQVINTFIKDRIQYIIDIPEDKKEELILILDTVPLTIDLFITLQKGKYKINIQNEIFYTNKGKTSIFGCFKLNSKKKYVEDY
jgi:hypothetical protein